MSRITRRQASRPLLLGFPEHDFGFGADANTISKETPHSTVKGFRVVSAMAVALNDDQALSHCFFQTL